MLFPESPNWRPLETLAPAYLGDFMWMFEVELEDGDRIQAYKHYWTRRYLYLGDRGRLFGYCEKETYEEVHRDFEWLLDQVLLEWREEPPCLDPVRRGLWVREVEVSWTRSATRHRVSKERSRQVIVEADVHLLQGTPEEVGLLEREPRYVFLGEDRRGIPLEVIAVEVEGEEDEPGEDYGEPRLAELRVIHASRVRREYLAHYDKVQRWRR